MEDKETKKQASTEPSEALSVAKEGYFVNRSYSYGEDVDFINEQKEIRKPIIRKHAFVDFPGVDEAVEEGRRYNRFSKSSFADWMKYVEKETIGPSFGYRVEFSRPDEKSETRILWMLQPHSTPDDDGFGMGHTPEIMLSTTLDENGNYTGAFRLERIGW